MFSRYVSILVVILLVPTTSFATVPDLLISDKTVAQSEMPYVYVNSTDYNILSNVISKIEEERNLLGSWEFPASSNDTRVFYGLTGMAGLGMRFLTSLPKLSILSESQRNKLLGFAEDIASELEAKALVNNSTQLIIPVGNNATTVDYGYDFGLAGISAFFSLLYNYTSNISYKNSAFKILNSISKATNQSDGIHWKSQLFPILNNTDWYPYFDYLAVNQSSPSFLGIAFGAAGVAKASLEYLLLTGDSVNSTVKSILNDSINWILGYKSVNLTEIAFPLVSEVNDVYSSSWGSGISGILDLFSMVQVFDPTFGLQDEIDGMVDWLIGVNEDFPRIGVTWFNASDELYEQVEYGKRFGSVGTMDVLLRFSEGSVSVQNALDEELLNFLFIGDEEDGKTLYPERVEENFLIREGSISFEFGSGGMVEFLSNVNLTAYPYLEGLAARVKASLYDSLDFEELVFIDTEFGKIDFNPMNGLPSILEYLNTDIKGDAYIPTISKDYGRLSVDENRTKTVTIFNFGDGMVSISLNSTNPSFKISLLSFKMDEWAILSIPIVFSPLSEGENSGKLIVEYNDETFGTLGSATIALFGVGIIPPVISLISPNNGTTINGKVKFVFSIFDDSGIKTATYSIFKEGFDNAVLSGSFSQTGNNYSVEVDTLKLGNGTFTMSVFAIDFLEVQSELVVSFTVENVVLGTSPDRTVNLLLWVLGSFTAAAAGGALFFTIKYVRRGNA